MTLQEKMFTELREKKIFDLARTYAYIYADQVRSMDVFPKRERIQDLEIFEESLPQHSIEAKRVIAQLHTYGSPATLAQTGGRYYGFVNGGVLPVAIATKWLTDFWDQNGGLYLTSPLNAKLEEVCQRWLVDLFQLPTHSVAGFVSGTSTANLCGLAAGRYRLLKNQGWDINEKGLGGAPELKIIAHKGIHGSVIKALALLGYGRENVRWIADDNQGRIQAELLPDLDEYTLIILQAGNVHSGAFDPFDHVCDLANEKGAWVHIDGAFGLWAQASKALSYLTKGIDKACSWAVDGHKTLNTPYDSGIVLCRDADALIAAMQATGDYLMIKDRREPLLYTPEMSKRARAIELWATLKYLGRAGIDEMITLFHHRAEQLAHMLRHLNFRILNDVVFNQLIVAGGSEQETMKILANIQQSGDCWCGGSTWQGESIIRVSVCSWATTENDINRTVAAFVEAREKSAEK
ncbi:MAG: aminotransferase class V-fold PLP-dependent enzyme [Saprospiraceae bacterium]|nr:aminotransferase class V-fold PLP-dependent enzyme [Saprospiraceae bacterium]